MARCVLSLVMAGLDPAIHVFPSAVKTWTPGTSPGVTDRLDL
jgi:hypothetical protein